MQTFSIEKGIAIIDNLIQTFRNNKQFLSDIDGLIGDGDHGINMNKGFNLTCEELDKRPGNLVYGLKVLSEMLMSRIGGAMGPLYGKFFDAIAATIDGMDKIGKAELRKAFNAGIEAIESISPAKIGDKTLIDTLVPAVSAYETALNEGSTFYDALEVLKNAAEKGYLSTKDMKAKIGRASRLGERSVGVLDPGAVSCYLILETMSNTIQELIIQEQEN